MPPEPRTTTPIGLLASYHPLAAVHDEMCSNRERRRPGIKHLVRLLERPATRWAPPLKRCDLHPTNEHDLRVTVDVLPVDGPD